MKAAVTEKYGPPDVIEIREVPKPEPKDNEVLVRVRATSVEIGDARVRALRVPAGMSLLVRLTMGFFKPKYPVFGIQMAGEIEAVGKNVTRYKVGDKVAGATGFTFGCHAEYVVLPEDGALALKPERLSFAEAVSVLFGGATAVTFFRQGQLRAGQTILVNGASGSVGVAAVPLAKHLGAKVTGVCSGGNAELVKSLGAEKVIDYTKEDFADGRVRYDVVMDNVGNAPFSRAKKALKPEGRLFAVIFDGLWQMILNSFNKSRVVMVDGTDEKAVFNHEMFAHLMELAGKGILRPVIDSTYPLERIREAHARVDTGHKVGCVVVTV